MFVSQTCCPRSLLPILPVSAVNSDPAVTRALPVLMADEETVSSEQLLTSQLCRTVESSLNVASDQEDCNVSSPEHAVTSSNSEDLPAAVDSFLPDARVLPALEALPDIPTVVTFDVTGSVISYQRQASSPSEGSMCFSERSTLPLLQHQSHRSSFLEQRQYLPSLLPSSATSAQRRLSSRTCHELEALTSLYKSTVAASRRSSSPMTAGVGSTSAVRDADRAYRLQQFVFRLSDLVNGCLLFARELPCFVEFPVEIRMALVKAGAPTFILIRAAELYDEARAAWVNELGDVVPATVVDDLLAESRWNAGINVAIATAHYGHHFWEFLSAVKRAIPGCSLGSNSPNQTVISLLQSIALLSPELVPPVIVSGNVLDALANAQQHYICLLRQHLEATSSFDEAAVWWPKLLSGAVEACKLAAHRMRDLLLSCDAVHCDELLMEIL